MLQILPLGGYKSLRLGVTNPYVWGLDFSRLGVTNPYVLGLDFLRLGIQIFLLGDWISYVWGFEILTFTG